MSLLSTGSKDISLKSDAVGFLGFEFGIGTTRDCFHSLGGLLHLIEMLKSEVTDGAISSATAFSILAEILSGPLGSMTSSGFNILQTSSTVQKMYLNIHLFAHNEMGEGRDTTIQSC